LWPILFPSAIKETKRRKSSGFFEALKLMGELADFGVDADTIPGASGEFGLTETNPIPTRTPLGSEAYLSRLRTEGGDPISWSRQGSTLADDGGMPIDMYSIRSHADEPLTTLFICPYHKRNSRIAPKGFLLASGLAK
jgi:hypothetical protein